METRLKTQILANNKIIFGVINSKIYAVVYMQTPAIRHTQALKFYDNFVISVFNPISVGGGDRIQSTQHKKDRQSPYKMAS